MTEPRLEAVYFGQGERGERYARLARVLEYSARQHCKDWCVSVRYIEPPSYTSNMQNPSHVWNTQKLKEWKDAVLDAQDGERILLIDGDMMILKPLDDIWERSFDIAYTIRESGRLPLNGGVVFVRVTDKSRAFVESWWDQNLRFLSDAKSHAIWRQKYAGINQSAFGYVLERVQHGCSLLTVPCQQWNCENTEWAHFDEKTRIVHVKSKLRRALFGLCTPGSSEKRLISIWMKLEREAIGELHAVSGHVD
jgi:hypothetical protein